MDGISEEKRKKVEGIILYIDELVGRISNGGICNEDGKSEMLERGYDLLLSYCDVKEEDKDEFKKNSFLCLETIYFYFRDRFVADMVNRIE